MQERLRTLQKNNIYQGAVVQLVERLTGSQKVRGFESPRSTKVWSIAVGLGC